MAYNTPIASIYHLYTTYILPSGGLYATYHLLREPKTTIEPRTFSRCFWVLYVLVFCRCSLMSPLLGLRCFLDAKNWPGKRGKTRWWFQIFFIFGPILWEMIQFDEHIFQTGWNHQLEKDAAQNINKDVTFSLATRSEFELNASKIKFQIIHFETILAASHPWTYQVIKYDPPILWSPNLVSLCFFSISPSKIPPSEVVPKCPASWSCIVGAGSYPLRCFDVSARYRLHWPRSIVAGKSVTWRNRFSELLGL